MSFFKMPHLNKEGKLSQEDAILIYQTYLTTERKNFKDESVRPIRSAIYKAMLKEHKEQTVEVAPIVQTQIDNGGRLLFWSDQHFFHHNIIKFSGRPYENISHMNFEMLANYTEMVNANDVVIFGGDVAFGELEEAQQLLQNLPGIKLLVMGNHEFGKKNDFRNYEIFEATTMCFVLYMKINKKICNVIVTHYPIDNKWLPKNTINIHGHIHAYLADAKNINMAVEHTNYRPKDFTQEIEEVFSYYCN